MGHDRGPAGYLPSSAGDNRVLAGETARSLLSNGTHGAEIVKIAEKQEAIVNW